MNNSIERELKMSLNKEEYAELLSAGNVAPQLQTNHYFYCADMPVDIMLRIRHKDGKYLFCYKKLLSCENGVNVCDERETYIDGEMSDSLLSNGITPAQLKRLVDVDTQSNYKYAGSLHTYRAKFPLDKWLIELDKNEYLGVTDYELECECASDELLGELKDYLLCNYGFTFKPSLSKSARFFERLKSM